MTSSTFIGQQAAWQEWVSALASERMHHAWLLAGAKGLGKGDFARAAAAELVGAGEGAVVSPSTHPDIHILEHLPANDDEAKKKAEGKPYQSKRNISVDQVRSMIRRLSTKPTMGNLRAIVVDPADDLEKSAVNALLKALEEPPAGTFFLLVAHQPGRLLPTVRSRCRVLRFAPLSAENLDVVLRREFPEAEATLREQAIAAAGGSPGVALAFVEHGLSKVHRLMQQIMSDGDSDFLLRGALADAMGTRPSRDRQLATLELARATLASELPTAASRRQPAVIEAHAALTRLSAQAPTYNFDSGLLILEIGGLLASAAMPREAAHQT
ncbi:DNA polymerase III subunit delta' [Novosphingobium sp. RD2P27]|uniref:DNA polymerase III subunit delta n=1 Tax=Novosphingobium kalidii TaxID=3230299 RepID=A0ABV2CY51_9SPHN